MRIIGKLQNQTDAQRFIDYALALGIECELAEADDAHEIWVHDEDFVDQAREELEQFEQQPTAAKYVVAAESTQHIRAARREREIQNQQRQVDERRQWQRPDLKQSPVTLFLIGASVAVALWTQLGDRQEPGIRLLSIAEYHTEGDIISYRGRYDWSNIQEGEVWRLVTPIFLHFSVMHILFNMLWVLDLCTQIEARRGSLRTAMIVLAIAIVSNVGQYWFDSDGLPTFGGMSGVVFGLFGYIWMKSRSAPETGLFIKPQVVVLMLVWFFVCLTGMVGPIANGAHGFGLATGMVLGGLPSFQQRITG